jgi:hypothetical protein
MQDFVVHSSYFYLTYLFSGYASLIVDLCSPIVAGK